MRDLFHNIKAVTTVPAANLSGNGTTTKGLAVDRQGYSSATAIVEVGDSADTLSGSVYFTAQLLHSDTTVDGDFVAVPVANMLGGSQGAAGEIGIVNDSTADKLDLMAGYIGGKRYLRVDIIRTGNNATGTPIAASVILGHPVDAPPSASTARGAALT